MILKLEIYSFVLASIHEGGSTILLTPIVFGIKASDANSLISIDSKDSDLVHVWEFGND